MRYSIPLIIAFFLINPWPTIAQPTTQELRMVRHGDRSSEGFMKQLNLTEEQENKLKKLQLGTEKKQAEVQAKVHMARLNLKEMLLADKLDRASIEKGLKSISDLQQQLKLNMVDHWFVVNGMLTTDQQKVWKKRLEQLTSGGRRGMAHMDGSRRIPRMMMRREMQR